MQPGHIHVLMRAAMFRSMAARKELTEYSLSLIGAFVGPAEAEEVMRLEERSERESARFSLWRARYAEAQRISSAETPAAVVA